MNKLVKFKESKKLTWLQFAEKIGITSANIQRIASGRATDVKLSTAQRIKEVTGLDPSDYLPSKK